MRKKEAMSDHSASDELAVASNDKSRKMRAGFATLAVLGLGAGVTLAAWTDNVPFRVNAYGATVVLEGAFGDADGPSTAWSRVAGYGDEDLNLTTPVETYLHVRDANGSDLNPSSFQASLRDGHSRHGLVDVAVDDVVDMNDGTVRVQVEATRSADTSSDQSGKMFDYFFVDVNGSHE